MSDTYNPEEEFEGYVFNPDINVSDVLKNDSAWIFLIFLLLFLGPDFDQDAFYRAADELMEKEKPKENRPGQGAVGEPIKC